MNYHATPNTLPSTPAPHIPIRQRILEANEFLSNIIAKYDNFDARLSGNLVGGATPDETKEGPRDIDAEMDRLLTLLNCIDGRIDRLSRIA